MTRSGAGRGRALLRWAITGKLPLIGYVTVPDTAPLLSQAQLARLRDRTAASLAPWLAGTESSARSWCC